MLEIILVGFATILSLFFILLWIEDHFNQDDEFVTVKDWHNFQTAMNKKGKN